MYSNQPPSRAWAPFPACNLLPTCCQPGAGGVKLHLELSLLLGTAAEACLQAAAALYRLSWPLLGPTALTVQAVAAAVGGASWGCAAAADVLLVLLWPLVLLYVVAAHLQQLQLTCLAATWRLIRGKQKVRMVVEWAWGWGASCLLMGANG